MRELRNPPMEKPDGQLIEKPEEMDSDQQADIFDILEDLVEVERPESEILEEAIDTFWRELEDENPVKYDLQPLADNVESLLKVDDNGNVYVENGRLLPNITYKLGDNVYWTDDKGRIIKCESVPKSTPENPRDIDAQAKVGGEDRRPKDQGGHIVGRDMGGDGGVGNLTSMDSRINQSDYKRMENYIKGAVNAGKDVSTKTELSYSGDSERADIITVTVTIDGVETVYTFNNNLDNSLISDLNETCSGTDIENIQGICDDTNGQVTSVMEEFSEDGSLIKTTAIITYVGNDGANHRRPVVINHNGGAAQ